MKKKNFTVISFVVCASLIFSTGVSANTDTETTETVNVEQQQTDSSVYANNDEQTEDVTDEELDDNEVVASEEDNAEEYSVQEDDEESDEDESDADESEDNEDTKGKKDKKANGNGLERALENVKGTPAEKIIADLLDLDEEALEEVADSLEELVEAAEEDADLAASLGLADDEELKLYAETLKQQIEASKKELKAQANLLKKLTKLYDKAGLSEEAIQVQLDVLSKSVTTLEDYQNLGQLYKKYGKAGVKAFVNGKQPNFEDATPIIKDGRTLVPFRAISEALNAEVAWDPETYTVTITRDGVTVSLTIGSNIALVNNQEVELEVPASLINGRTVVPARFIAEALKANVEWIPEGEIVVITDESITTEGDSTANEAVTEESATEETTTEESTEGTTVDTNVDENTEADQT